MTARPAVDFESRDLAVRVEALSASERDALPFGAVEMDRSGKVLSYNKTQEHISGYTVPAGGNLFEVSRSPSKDELKARIMRAMDEGPVDLDFAWIGGSSHREVRLRILSSARGGFWMFVEADSAV